MTARLRILPVYNGEPGQHYLILDCTERGELTEEMGKALHSAALRKGAEGIAFNFPVNLPDVDASVTGWTIHFHTTDDPAEVGAKVLDTLRDSPDLIVRRA